MSGRRIKLFPMMAGTRRAISRSDSSSLAKTGGRKPDESAAAASVTERPIPQDARNRNRMRRGSSLTDLNRSDSLAGTPPLHAVFPLPGMTRDWDNSGICFGHRKEIASSDRPRKIFVHIIYIYNYPHFEFPRCLCGFYPKSQSEVLTFQPIDFGTRSARVKISRLLNSKCTVYSEKLMFDVR